MPASSVASQPQGHNIFFIIRVAGHSIDLSSHRLYLWPLVIHGSDRVFSCFFASAYALSFTDLMACYEFEEEFLIDVQEKIHLDICIGVKPKG